MAKKTINLQVFFKITFLLFLVIIIKFMNQTLIVGILLMSYILAQE